MNTNELIDQLTTELQPVAALRPPGHRAAFWLLGAVLYFGALGLVVSWITPAAYSVDTGLLVSQLLGVAAGSVAVLAAFYSVVPGSSAAVKWAVVPLVVVWLAAFAAAAVGSNLQGMAEARHEWVCVGTILIGGSPLVVAMAVLLRRGAPLNPSLTGLLVALAVGSLANFGACLSLPHDNAATALVWHGGALVALTLVCVFGGRLVFRWQPVQGSSQR